MVSWVLFTILVTQHLVSELALASKGDNVTEPLWVDVTKAFSQSDSERALNDLDDVEYLDEGMPEPSDHNVNREINETSDESVAKNNNESSAEDRWKNGWDGHLNFQCLQGQHIKWMRSVHNNHKEDRLWDYSCEGGIVGNSCWWKNRGNYVNYWDRPLHSHCEHGGLVTGFKSDHNNHREDRRWKIKCCKPNIGVRPSNCHWTGWINHWDGDMNYHVPPGYGINGVYSYHNNHREDRLWAVYICRYTVCTAQSMRFLTNRFLSRPIGTSVIGIVTGHMCDATTSKSVTLSRLTTLTESVSVTASSSNSFSLGSSITTEASAGIDIKLFSASVKMSVTHSVGYTKTWSKSRQTSSSVSTSHGMGTSIQFKGPKAAMVYGIVNEYRFDKSRIPVEFTVKCVSAANPSRPSYVKRRGYISMKGHVYGKVHFQTRVGTYKSAAKCRAHSTIHCLHQLNGAKVMAARKILSDFDRCVAN